MLQTPASVTLGYQPRQIAGVINVRVRQYHCPQFLERNRQRSPIFQAQFLESLKQTIVDQHLAGRTGEHVLGSGDAARGSKEL